MTTNNKNSGNKSKGKKKEGLIKKEKTIEYIQTQVASILKEDEDISIKIRKLLKLKMPLEVAKILHIPADQVFSEIEAMPEDELKNIKKSFVNNRLNIASNIKSMKAKGKSSGQALTSIENQINGGLAIELAQVYFAMGEFTRAIRVMNHVIYSDSVSSQLKAKVKQEKDNLDMEIKALKIRQTYKKYLEEDKPSYDSLCRSFNVRTGFLVNVLGMEERRR